MPDVKSCAVATKILSKFYWFEVKREFRPTVLTLCTCGDVIEEDCFHVEFNPLANLAPYAAARRV